MKALKSYTTGRTYDTAQVLVFTILESFPDVNGFFDNVVVFQDDSRHITGISRMFDFKDYITGADLLASYDAGNYTGISSFEFERCLSDDRYAYTKAKSMLHG
jgi:hypothetical protein